MLQNAPKIGLYFLLPLFLLACSGPGAARHVVEHSAFETEPEGASIYIDGGFVGTTPTKFYLPAKDTVELRIQRPGYLPHEEELYRDKVGEGAGEGVGWESLYFFPLTAKR